LQQIRDGATAGSLDTETLDFKRGPHTVTGRGASGNPQVRLVEELVDVVVCFANARGGRIVLGVDDRTPGPDAFVGTEVDPRFLRNRIYRNSRRRPRHRLRALSRRHTAWQADPRRINGDTH
jgi:ATP-dependent DNA helicase RecG